MISYKIMIDNTHRKISSSNLNIGLLSRVDSYLT